jgi:peptide/nickel transport system ATP-binding protein
LLITHDLAVVGALCHRTYVMYKGRIVESGPTADIIHRPGHAYTRALLNALQDGKKPRTRLETVAAAMLEGSSAPAHRIAPVIRPIPSGAPLLEVKDITVRYPRAYDALGRPKDFHTAVDRVSLTLSEGETVSIVGESGCGKTSFANALLGLVPIDGGAVLYRGSDLKKAAAAARREIQIVFQDPMSSLDPRWPIWRTMTEPLTVGASVSAKARREAARDLSEMVGLDPNAIERLPHEFSGGQRQRIAIGRALSVEPRLLILDEPTSALDVSVQAQILNLLLDLQDAHGLAYLFISHNMSVVRHMSDRIAVMLGGRIVEHGPAEQVIAAPRNDYTKSLLAAVPRLDAGETS